jgi:hypothetical protein
MPPTSHTILDACSLLNLFASRYIEDILRLSYIFHIAEAVHKETLYIRRGGNGEDAEEHDLVDLAPLLSSNLLVVDALGSAVELASYIQFATQLDDGEAMTCALASHRNWQVVTDDRKVPRVLRAVAPHINCRTTLDVLKEWVDTAGIDDATLKDILLDIRKRANYFPAVSHPLKYWWDNILAQ